MCCCGKPTINGEHGYRSQPDGLPSIYSVRPPNLGDHDTLLHDEPGRCGGIDCHSHHFRVVRRFDLFLLLVRHGGGDEELLLSCPESLQATLATLDTNARYWVLHAIYCAHAEGERDAKDATDDKWCRAAAERRIKTRKQRGSGTVKVWIEQR
jgi:hypothetical protein